MRFIEKLANFIQKADIAPRSMGGNAIPKATVFGQSKPCPDCYSINKRESGSNPVYLLMCLACRNTLINVGATLLNDFSQNMLIIKGNSALTLKELALRIKRSDSSIDEELKKYQDWFVRNDLKKSNYFKGLKLETAYLTPFNLYLIYQMILNCFKSPFNNSGDYLKKMFFFQIV